MKALFELFRRFDARRIFGFIRRLGGMSRPKVECYDLRSTRALRVEGDGAEIGRRVFIGISIHALRVEGDRPPRAVLRTSRAISIHALRVEGDIPHDDRAASRRTISIHALRVEGDLRSKNQERVHAISIHALRVEGDPGAAGGSASKRGFLSTPSGWRATCTYRRSFATVFYFYPRPPGGGRRDRAAYIGLLSNQFLSTPSGWRATGNYSGAASGYGFLSTPSGWRATRSISSLLSVKVFLSTPSGWRATTPRLTAAAQARDFYPRPPGGGRLISGSQPPPRRYFYPRPPGGGRLPRLIEKAPVIIISIHALRVEGDEQGDLNNGTESEFLSTPSGWRATKTTVSNIESLRFLSTPSGWRATAAAPPREPLIAYFYPRPPGGGRLLHIHAN